MHKILIADVSIGLVQCNAYNTGGTMHQRCYWLIVLGVGFAISSRGLAASFDIINVDGFDPVAMSADGSTLVGTIWANSPDEQVVVWSQATGAEYLPIPANTPSYPTGISANGSIVVGYNVIIPGTETTVGLGSAWEWTAATGYESLVPPGYAGSSTPSISNDGNTIGVSGEQSTSPYFHAYLLTASNGYVSLPATPSGGIPYYANVSADGTAAIGRTEITDNPYVWTAAGESQDIPNIPGTTNNFIPQLLTPDGSIVFGTATNEMGKVFEYANGTITELLGHIQGGITNLTGVTADGSMVVGNGPEGIPPNPYPFVWTPSGGFATVQSVLAADGVNLGNFVITAIDGVSQDGNELYGQGYVPLSDSTTTGWIAYLPEPGSLALFLPLAAASRHRKNKLHPAAA